jgi:L-lactate dehydrogenase complex protein LldE
VKYGAISAAMGDTKAANVVASGAEFVTSIDSSCLMHLQGVMGRRGDMARTIHIASILAAQERR